MTRFTRVPHSLVALAAVAASALALSACAPAASTPDPTSTEWELSETTPAPTGDIDSFTWSIYAEPFSLDYAYAFDYADNQVLANVCESLLRLNPDYSLSPGLAESATQTAPQSIAVCTMLMSNRVSSNCASQYRTPPRRPRVSSVGIRSSVCSTFSQRECPTLNRPESQS